MKTFKVATLIVSVLLGAGSARAIDLRVTESSTVVLDPVSTGTSTKPAERKKLDVGESFNLPSGSSAWILSEGRHPVWVLRPQAEVTALEVNPPKVAEVQSTKWIRVSEVDGLLSKYLEVQGFVAGEQYEDALKSLDALMESHPRIAQLYFTRSSVLFLQGEKTAARLALEEGIRLAPRSPAAIDMLELLNSEGMAQ